MKKHILISLLLIGALVFWLAVLHTFAGAVLYVVTLDPVFGLIFLVSGAVTLVCTIALKFSKNYREASFNMFQHMRWPG